MHYGWRVARFLFTFCESNGERFPLSNGMPKYDFILCMETIRISNFTLSNASQFIFMHGRWMNLDEIGWNSVVTVTFVSVKWLSPSVLTYYKLTVHYFWRVSHNFGSFKLFCIFHIYLSAIFVIVLGKCAQSSWTLPELPEFYRTVESTEIPRGHCLFESVPESPR